LERNNAFATKYLLIEKLHIDNNNINDPYSSTKYPHRLFNLSFESDEIKEPFRSKIAGLSRNYNNDILNVYMNEYLEESLKIQMETRNDYDSYLSDLFPNHNQHIEYLIKILTLMSQFFINKYILDFVNKWKEDGTGPQSNDATMKKTNMLGGVRMKIIILMMSLVLRVEEKLSNAAEKHLLYILDTSKFNEKLCDKIYNHLEQILEK
jgi:hypothetical protein